LSFSSQKLYPDSPRANVSGFFYVQELREEEDGKSCVSNAETTAVPAHNPSQKPKNHYFFTPVASTAEAVHTASVQSLAIIGHHE